MMLQVAVCGRTSAETAALSAAVCLWAEDTDRETDVAQFQITELSKAISGGTDFDIFIIDAECGGSAGLEAAELINKFLPCASAILMSDSGAQARAAYAANAVRLLIKPFSRKTFCEALCFAEKACIALKKIRQYSDAGKMSGDSTALGLSSIVYITNEKHSHIVQYSDGSCGGGTHRSGLGEHFSELLELPMFVRISSSCIIGINHVREVYTNCVVMSNGEMFRLGRSRRGEVLEKIRSAIAGGNTHRDIKFYTTNKKQD